MRGAVLQGVLGDEPIEVVCQCAGHLGGTPRAGAIHQAWDALGGEAIDPLAQRGIGKVQRVRHHLEAVPLDDFTHRLGTAEDTGFFRQLKQSIQGGERLLRKVEFEGPHRGGLQEIRLQKCTGGHSPELLLLKHNLFNSNFSGAACSHRGKVDNCQVGVFMGYVSRHDHALLDFRLYLPQEWARDEQRRQECHVPEDVSYRSRHEQCLEMLDAWSAQVPHGWVTGDDELGRHTQFRYALRARGERYVLGVPCTTMIRDLEAPLPAYQGRGRRPKAPWQSVRGWRQSLGSAGWIHLTVRDGEKGPVPLKRSWDQVELS